MTIFEIIVLAIIQGITEFLPISSSGHLLLPAELLGWQKQGLGFDVAVHVGSLLAIVIYLRKDIAQLTVGWCQSVTGKKNDNGRLAWLIVMATLPAVVIGYTGKAFVEAYTRSGLVIATTTIVFALLLWWADRASKQQFDVSDMNWKKALIIGFAQVTAMIPGTSRSGITMTAALFLGFNRESAARFSFLLSVPVIMGAGTLMGIDMMQSEETVDWNSIFWGAGLSFVSAYICVALFIRWISRIGMLPFVIYRLALGVILFWVLLG